jgi:cytochrome P450
MGPVEPRDPESGDLLRNADEVVVDLMSSACGIDFEEASSMVEAAEIEGIRIPFASPEPLLRTKQTVREKDEIDRLFLQRLIAERRKE